MLFGLVVLVFLFFLMVINMWVISYLLLIVIVIIGWIGLGFVLLLLSFGVMCGVDFMLIV